MNLSIIGIVPEPIKGPIILSFAIFYIFDFPFSIFYFYFPFFIEENQTMTNIKWKMTNGKWKMTGSAGNPVLLSHCHSP